MPDHDYGAMSDVELEAVVVGLAAGRHQADDEMRAAGMDATRRAQAIRNVADAQQLARKEQLRRRAVADAIAIADTLSETEALDLEGMDDVEIKREKTRLYHLRRNAGPAADALLRDEMIRLQEVINVRQRERTKQFEYIAEVTPGAVSVRIAGVAASAGADAVPQGG